jgi:hypothetical protein
MLIMLRKKSDDGGETNVTRKVVIIYQNFISVIRQGLQDRLFNSVST